MPVEYQEGLSFDVLKSRLGQILDRGGDEEMNATLKGHYVNEAEQWLCQKVGGWAKFLEYTGELIVPGSSVESPQQLGAVIMPYNVKEIIAVRDETNNTPLRFLPRHLWTEILVKPDSTRGTPRVWTRWGYERSNNAESPAQSYGRHILRFWPLPTSDFTCYFDGILLPGAMVADTDFPILPPEYHQMLVDIAVFLATPYDARKGDVFQQRSMLVQDFVQTIIHDQMRMVAGNQRFITRQELTRKTAGVSLLPPTRMSQLFGG